MRMILFKGYYENPHYPKEGQQPQWVTGIPVVEAGGGIAIYRRDNEDHLEIYPVNPDSVWQYTGMRDVEGFMIFEADTVRYINSETGKEDERDRTVTFKNGKFTNCRPKIILGEVYLPYIVDSICEKSL